MSTTPVILHKKINASPQTIFSAWREPKLLEQWLKPNTEWKAVSRNDFIVGGEYYQEMIAADGKTYPHFGEYKEIVLSERLVMTWNSNNVKNTLVTIELREIGDATEITLTHDFFQGEKMKQDHYQGWQECLENLSVLCEKPS